MELLEACGDVVVAEAGERELEACVIGSYRDEAHRRELAARLGPWQFEHPEARFELA